MRSLFFLLIACARACLLETCLRSVAKPYYPSFSPDANTLNRLSERVNSFGIWRGTAFQGSPPGRLENVVSNCTKHGVLIEYCERWYWLGTGLAYARGAVDHAYGGCTCTAAGNNSKYCQNWTCTTLVISGQVCRFKEGRKDCQKSETEATMELDRLFENHIHEDAFVAEDGGVWGWWSNASLCVVLGNLTGSIDHQQTEIHRYCKGQEWFRRAWHDTSSCTCDSTSSKSTHCVAWSCEKLPYGVDERMRAFETQYRYAEDTDVSKWQEHYECEVGGAGSCLEFTGTKRSWLGGAVSLCKCDERQNCACDSYSLPLMMPWWYHERWCLTFLVLMVIASLCTTRQLQSRVDSQSSVALRLCVVGDTILAALCLYALGLYGLLSLSLPVLCTLYIIWMMPDDKATTNKTSYYEAAALE